MWSNSYQSFDNCLSKENHIQIHSRASYLGNHPGPGEGDKQNPLLGKLFSTQSQLKTNKRTQISTDGTAEL